MQIAKRYPQFVPAPRIAETVTAVWILIVILLGVFFFALYNLANRVAG